MKSPEPELKPRLIRPTTLAAAALAVVMLVGMALGKVRAASMATRQEAESCPPRSTPSRPLSSSARR